MTPAQYNKINDLLVSFSAISAAVEGAEAEIKTVQLAAARELLPKYAAAKVGLGNIEAELRSLAEQFYGELFPTDARTHATPFGSLKFKKSSSIEFDDEEKVILRIERESDRELENCEREATAPRFTSAGLLRTKVHLNLEALAELDDKTLALFGVRRQVTDNFKVTPPTVKTDRPKKTEKEAA
jgi:Bacteriophage Mu Gam like protein